MNIKTFKTADQAVAYIDLTDLTEKQKAVARYQIDTNSIAKINGTALIVDKYDILK